MIYMTAQTSETAKEKQERIGLQLAKAFDGLWTKMQSYHPDLPDAALFVSPMAHTTDGRGKTGSVTLGHFGAKRWKLADGSQREMGEVVISAEHMARRGPAGVLETVLHEGAHCMAEGRGVEDTSQEGRYHNGNFKAVAEEMGLVVSKHTPEAGRGFAQTDLADGTLERYFVEVNQLDAALIALDENAPKRVRPPARPGPLKVVCKCHKPRVLRVSPAVLKAGAITCGVCSEAFNPEA
jgi:hypothetical protein